ncbi:MAG: LysE family transporter [Eubacteriales bacterium]|nr:LysE family transporter [Eubacteriales bacterium]
MFTSMLVYMIVMDITPGPNNLTMLYLGSRYGLKGTRKFLTASVICFFLKMVLCGALNQALAEFIPQIMNVLKWLGAAYMLYLAVVMAKSGWADDSELKAQQHESSYRSGVLLQILNVKSWIAAVTLFAVYVIPYPEMKVSVPGASALNTLIMLISSLIWGAFGSVMRNLISMYKKPFGILMGLSLLYCTVTAVL